MMRQEEINKAFEMYYSEDPINHELANQMLSRVYDDKSHLLIDFVEFMDLDRFNLKPENISAQLYKEILYCEFNLFDFNLNISTSNIHQGVYYIDISYNLNSITRDHFNTMSDSWRLELIHDIQEYFSY